MSEAAPPNILEFVQRTDGTPMERCELKDIFAGAIVRAASESSIWLIEVTGHDQNGCVEGFVTYVSENPLKNWGLQESPATGLIILHTPAIVGGFLSTDDERLVMEATLPDRSPRTLIQTRNLGSFTYFRSEQE